MASTYDAIVVGGGSVGVPSAYYLARRGLKVLLLDRRSAVGQGENKCAIGGVRATHSDPAKIVLCIKSLEVLTAWKETHGDDIGWKPGGYVFPVYSEDMEKRLTGLFTIQRKYGLDNRWVSPEQVNELVPGINRENLRGGTWSPGDGQVSPIVLPIVLMRHAMRLGTEVHVGEKVTGYIQERDRILGVKTDKDTYLAPHVIVATGSDAAQDGKALGIEIPVKPDVHEAGITAPLEHFIKPLVVDMRPGPEGKTANFYFGQNSEGQIIFCYTPKPQIWGEDKFNTSEFLPILAARMIDLVPRLRHMLVRRTWRGCYPMTPDGVPIIDNVASIQGLTLAVGMCGQGFMLGIGVGQEVASLALDGKSLLPAEAHEAVQFSRNFHAGKMEALK